MTHAATAAHDEGETAGGLALVVRELLVPLGLEVTSVEPEPDNAEYGAVLVRTSGSGSGVGDAAGPVVRVRRGKVTPTKVGLFVTHWRRSDDGTTGPYDEHDEADVLLVTVAEPQTSESSTHPSRGVFVLDREALLAHGILARDSVGSKRGFRVYPPWSETAPGQATRTQRWQLDYFVPLPVTPTEASRAARLLSL